MPEIGLLRFYRHLCKDLVSGLEVATQPQILVPKSIQYFAENGPRRSHGLVPARPVRIGSNSSSGVNVSAPASLSAQVRRTSSSPRTVIPQLTSHTLAVSSKDAVTIRAPSGLNAASI